MTEKQIEIEALSLMWRLAILEAINDWIDDDADKADQMKLGDAIELADHASTTIADWVRSRKPSAGNENASAPPTDEEQMAEIKCRMMARTVEKLIADGSSPDEAKALAVAALYSPSRVKLPTIEELDDAPPQNCDQGDDITLNAPSRNAKPPTDEESSHD
jgi:hypothetical protein